ncbi:unnamed protein product [Ambrosiozyma monospora]|uniref:Unnamed protein product n=1 Tax=Ambrosiozyma monospora TaxID=43982 RepID=A0ACB5TQF9_AMBMO|nr:unnamed protein product [Ambrosiozyma monospora]
MTIGKHKKDEKIFDPSELQFYSSSTLATILPIPSKWVHPQELNSNLDKNACPFEVTFDGCEISTKDLMRRKPNRTSAGRFSSGSSSSRNNVFSTRSDHHVLRLTTVYYFEVEILFSLNSGADVSIGFFDLRENDNQVSDLRGHDIGSWGYCGKEGRLYYKENGRLMSKSTLKFCNGDTIGCGVNFVRNTIFVTKNGVYVGEAFTIPDTVETLFPAISLAQWNAVKTNFGLNQNEKFKFDIDGYVEAFKLDLFKKVEDFKIPKLTLKDGSTITDNSDVKKMINSMVKSYFVHMGFSESLKSFKKDLSLEETNVKHTDAEIGEKLMRETEFKRQVKLSIMNDDINKTLKLINCEHPQILENEGKVLNFKFRLECLKLVILIKDGKIDESLELAALLKDQFKEKQYQEYLKLVVQLLAFQDPRESPYFRILYSFEKSRLIDNLVTCVNFKTGLPPQSSIDNVIIHTDANLGQDPSSELIDLIEDYTTL